MFGLKKLKEEVFTLKNTVEDLKWKINYYIDTNKSIRRDLEVLEDTVRHKNRIFEALISDFFKNKNLPFVLEGESNVLYQVKYEYTTNKYLVAKLEESDKGHSRNSYIQYHDFDSLVKFMNRENLFVVK